MHPSPAEPPGAEALAPGTLVAERFRIEGFAARGGMSAVYRASDLATGAPVAIKVLAREGARGDDRLATEVDVLAGLSHPAIVRYVAHGLTPSRRAFLAMEWLTGEDLAARLAREGLRVSESLALLASLCSGLALAHARGIVHRDIKPSNVFLVGGDVSAVKLLDFGVARRGLGSRTLSKAGTLLGTVGYMAPEQARGAHDLDARADVFALGALLFECLTGQPAFAAAHEIAVLAKVLRDEPPTLSGLRPELASLDVLLARLLAKDRAARPADAGAVLALLREVYTGATLADAPASVVTKPRPRDAEQRIASVILGAPEPGYVPDDPAGAAAKIEALAHAFGAEASALFGGALLLGLGAEASSAPTDQAVRAVRCALRLATLCPRLTVGVATGTVDTSGAVPVGPAIDRAASLVTGTERAVRIDALTADLLGARFVVQRDAGGLVVLGEREESDDSDVLMGKSTPFVGRGKELALLSATLRECIDDEVARGILLTAPAGAGKSRLGREFLERARGESGVRVLRAGADPTSAGSTLSLVQRLLRGAVGARDGEPSARQRDRLAAYLRLHRDAPAGPHTYDFLCEILDVGLKLPEGALHRAARADPEVMRAQKRRAFEQWMSWELEQGPVLVFLEDLHWGDLPSVTYVQELMQSLSARPLFVLATARPEVHAQFPRLREAGAFDELVLRGLTRRASEQLARAMLPLATDEAVRAKVVGLASGNAFYLEELVRHVAEGAGSALPETVVAMAQSRLERLPAEARRVLRAASVFGETAWAGGVARLLGASDAGERADGQLAWLVEQEILQPRATPRFPGERELVFRHALLREAAYAMLTEADRRRAHLAAAEWLTARGERDARVLADHFERGGALARALPWIVKAAMAALDGGDLASAIALAQRGLELGAHGESRGMLLLVRAYASVWGARRDFALPREALALLPRASAPWWLALSIHVFGSSLLGQPDLAAPYLEIALSTSPGGELSGAYGQAVQTLAVGAALVGRTGVGWALVRHCEREAGDREALLDPAFLAWLDLTRCALSASALDDCGRWALGDAIRHGRASVAAMRVLGSRLGEAAALFHLGNALWLAGGYAQASGILQESLSVAKQTGYLLIEQHASLLLSVGALRGGARSDAEAALHALARAHNSQIAHGAETVLADLCFREGRIDEALARARACVAGPSLLYRRMAQSILARVHLARGQADAALDAVARAFADGGATAFPHLSIDLLGSRARAHAACGAAEQATRAVEAALALRAATAATLEDPLLRRAFVSRGPANKLLDALAGNVAEPPTT